MKLFTARRSFGRMVLAARFWGSVALVGTHSVAAQSPLLLPATSLRNAVAVAVTGPLPLTFSAPIDAVSASQLCVVGSQGLGRRAIVPTVAASTVSLSMAGRFFAGEVVSLSIPHTVRGTNGQAAQPQTLRFSAAVQGTGRGTFTAGPDVPLALGRNSEAVADIDADGDLDLLVTQTGGAGTPSSTVAIRLNDGRGNFSGTATVNTASVPFALAVADVDGDGDQDLLASNSFLSSW